LNTLGITGDFGAGANDATSERRIGADDLVFAQALRSIGPLITAMSVSEVCIDSQLNAMLIALSHKWHKWHKCVDCVSPRRKRAFQHERYATPEKAR
jgi:hypothetical protein